MRMMRVMVKEGCFWVQRGAVAGTVVAAGHTTPALTTPPVCVITSHTLEFCWYVTHQSHTSHTH